MKVNKNNNEIFQRTHSKIFYFIKKYYFNTILYKFFLIIEIILLSHVSAVTTKCIFHYFVDLFLTMIGQPLN